jgi:hypothetical protein
MNLNTRLELLRRHVRQHCPALPDPSPAYTVIFSVSGGEKRALIRHASADSFDEAWLQGISHIQRAIKREKIVPRHLRADWVESRTEQTWEAFQQLLSTVKRTYFRFGFSLDESHTHLLTEMECHANAIYYGGPKEPHGRFNTGNFAKYAKTRFGEVVPLPASAEQMVWSIGTAGAYMGPDNTIHSLPGLLSPKFGRLTRGLYTGHREIPRLNPVLLREIVLSASRWLAAQILPDGKFVYGYFPCFDKRIPSYNSLRHATSLYSLLDVMDFTGDRSPLNALRRSLQFMADKLVREYEPEPGRRMAFLVEDSAGEIKLGANGAALLAYAKYQELTGDLRYSALMDLLAEGIAWLQNPDSGAFPHVLDSETLAVKEQFRIIYYDGEAVLGLLRRYGQERNPRWLRLAQHAFEYFLGSEKHRTAHDHWLSYAANEICSHVPDERYFRFGIDNCAQILDFILYRETTYPTLLELSMAAQKLFLRAEKLGFSHLLNGIDMNTFMQALHYRAHYLLNGFFWPEMSMFFQSPVTVEGSFFIRHHAFRTRIDDAQHYLSGLAAYGMMLENGDPAWAAPEDARSLGTRFNRMREY